MKRMILLLSLLATPAYAQQAQEPDVALLKRALAAVQVQRNQAFDLAAGQQARADNLQDELTKAQARIKELEQAGQPKPPDKP